MKYKPSLKCTDGQVIPATCSEIPGKIFDGRPHLRPAIDEQRKRDVTFMAREKKKGGSRKQVPEELSGVEFTRRWSLHILPKGFTKSRCFGGYSSTNRTRFIAKCRQLQPPVAVAQQDEQQQVEATQLTAERPCPKCQQPMQLIAETRRPCWRDLFYGPDHQPWFEI